MKSLTASRIRRVRRRPVVVVWPGSSSRRAQRRLHCAQATAGQTAYEANCASCHVADLGGRNEAPQLAGAIS